MHRHAAVRRCSTATRSSRRRSRCFRRSKAWRWSTPTFQPYVVPLTLVILAMLFAVQRFGTGECRHVFGPVTALVVPRLGVSGLIHIVDDPEVLWPLNPCHGVIFLYAQPDRLRDARRDLPGRHRRRGALRRSRPFRPQADRARLVRAGLPVPAAELFRAGRLRAGE